MILIKIQEEINGDVALTVRQFRRVMTAVHYAVAKHWKERFLRLHFLPRARGRYNYQRRKDATKKRKLRLAAIGKVQEGGTQDLVWTGRLKLSMMAWARISATPGKATVHLIGPNYLRINYKPGRPHLANEILTVIPSEKEELNDVGRRVLATEMQAAAEETKRRQTRDARGRYMRSS